MIAAIAKEFDAVQNFGQHGTINVIDLTPPLCKCFADYWTGEVVWCPVAGQEKLGKVRPEYFGLIRINFECPVGSDSYDAWAIIVEGHPWAYSENGGVEIIAEAFIAGVKRGERCAIYLNHTPIVPRPPVFGSHFGRGLLTSSAAVPPHLPQ
jgi:hypothetical protein